MKYYMIKVIGRPFDRRWYFKVGTNYCGRRFINFNTFFGGVAFIFSSGNGHYLKEQTREEQKMIENYEHPRTKNGKLDMRFNRNKWLKSRWKHYLKDLFGYLWQS